MEKIFHPCIISRLPGGNGSVCPMGVLLETSCRCLDTTQNAAIPVATINITGYPLATDARGTSRWVGVLGIESDFSPLARDDTIQLYKSDTRCTANRDLCF